MKTSKDNDITVILNHNKFDKSHIINISKNTSNIFLLGRKAVIVVLVFMCTGSFFKRYEIVNRASNKHNRVCAIIHFQLELSNIILFSVPKPFVITIKILKT